MNIVIKCGESIELIQNVLEEIERKMPNILWASGELPTSWNPKKSDDDGKHVALFINDARELTFAKDSEEFIEHFISSYHGSDDVIYAEDFVSGEMPEDIENETDISLLFD